MKWVARTSISIRELGVIRENFLKVNDITNAIHAREENRRERERKGENRENHKNFRVLMCEHRPG